MDGSVNTPLSQEGGSEDDIAYDIKVVSDMQYRFMYIAGATYSPTGFDSSIIGKASNGDSNGFIMLLNNQAKKNKTYYIAVFF